MQYLLSLATLLLPTLAFAAPQTWSDFVARIVLIINVATPTMVALALTLFLVRILATMTGTGGGEGGGHGLAAGRFRIVALYGIGILFVMVSIWGILALLESEFLQGGGGGNFGGSSNEAGLPCTSLGDSGC